MRGVKFFTTVLLLASGAATWGAGKTYWYEIDTNKSQIAFLAKSRIAKAQGLFRKWEFKGKITSNFHVVGDLNIDCASIDTDNERRDNHLRAADFFDCTQFARHTFRILSVKTDDKSPAKVRRFDVSGELTIRGKSQPVSLELRREGDDKSFVLTGSAFIDREIYGITYNSALNPIEKMVRIDIRLTLVRKGDRP
ncbi:MAG: YceI family protein [Spirochaetota bacterium]